MGISLGECPFRVFMKKRRGYKFTNRKHSERAIMSTALGTIGMVSMIVVLAGSYRSGGEVGTGFGFTGLFAMLYALVGLVLGTLPLLEKRYYKLFSVLGIVLCLLTLGLVSACLYAGANL